MKYLTDKVQVDELERIRAFAYHCWGQMITIQLAMDIARLARGIPALRDNHDVPTLHIRHMVEFHADSWPLVRPKA